MLALRATAFHAAFVAAVTALKSSTNALFLAHGRPEDLAALYVVVAALVAVATALLAGPLRHRSPRRLLGAALVLFTLGMGALALLDASGAAGAPASVPASLYVAGELYATLGSVLFWSSVSGWFDSRTARRSFGLISAGGMAGAMAGGVAVGPLVGVLGAGGSAALAAAASIAALPLLGTREPSPAPPPTSIRSGARFLVSHPFPRILAALAAAYAALAACVDYIFRVEAAARMSEIELAELFGTLNAAVGAGAIAFQVLLSRFLLDRTGLFVFLAIVPVLLALVGAVGAATGAFAVLVAVKALEMAGSYSIQPLGMQLLYNPIPPESRGAVRAFVDGFVKKAGLAAAGLGLVVLVQGLPEAASPWLIVAGAAACLALLRWVRRGYLTALEDKLRGARAAVVVPTVEAADRATRKLLLRALHSPSGSEALSALAILRRDPRFDPAAHLEALLTHVDPAVRLAALDLVPADPRPDLEITLLGILSLDQRRPRAAAVRALARVRSDRALEVLEPCLRDPDPGVACAAVAALHPLPSATARLQELLADTGAGSPARRELARLLGELPAEVGVRHLPRFFEDPDESVRQIAMRSAARLFEGAVGDASAVAPLVQSVRARLGVRADRDDAREALVRLGDRVVPAMRESLDDRRLALAVRLEIPRILAKIGTAAAAAALLFSNIRDHPSLRYRIIEALFRLRRRHPDVDIDRARTDAACRRRLQAFTRYRPLAHAFAAARPGPFVDPAWDILCRALCDRLLQNLETALHLLGLHRGAERMDRVARLLVEAERRALAGAPRGEVRLVRADAIEILDVALQGDPLRDEVLAALERTAPEDPDPRRRDAATLARALARSADPLVAALAARTAHGLGPAFRESPSLMDLGDPTDSEEVESMDQRILNRILALEKIDLFAGLPVDDVAAIAGIAEERYAQGGEVLYREGDPGRNMMVIIRGRVKLERGGRPFMELGAGQSIGQVSLLDRGPRPVTAIAGSDPGGVDLLVIDCEEFMDLVTDRPGLTRGLFGVLAKRLRLLIELQGGKAD